MKKVFFIFSTLLLIISGCDDQHHARATGYKDMVSLMNKLGTGSQQAPNSDQASTSTQTADTLTNFDHNEINCAKCVPNCFTEVEGSRNLQWKPNPTDFCQRCNALINLNRCDGEGYSNTHYRYEELQPGTLPNTDVVPSYSSAFQRQGDGQGSGGDNGYGFMAHCGGNITTNCLEASRVYTPHQINCLDAGKKMQQAAEDIKNGNKGRAYLILAAIKPEVMQNAGSNDRFKSGFGDLVGELGELRNLPRDIGRIAGDAALSTLLLGGTIVKSEAAYAGQIVKNVAGQGEDELYSRLMLYANGMIHMARYSGPNIDPCDHRNDCNRGDANCLQAKETLCN